MEQLEARKIAFRYARALFDAALEQQSLETVIRDAGSLSRIYLDVPELADFFANPGIPLDEKKMLLNSRIKTGLTPLTANLLDLLTDNDRLVVLPEILTVFKELHHNHAGIARAEVTVAAAITPGIEDKLKASLEKVFGYKQVELTTTVNPGIIAGAIVRIGDKIIDGSYRGKLEMLKRQVG